MLSCPQPAHAQQPAGQTHASSWLYRLGRHPEQARARALLRQALGLLRSATGTLPGEWQTLCERVQGAQPVQPARSGTDAASGDAAATARRRALEALLRQSLEGRAELDDALARLTLALQLAPGDPQLHYLRARVLGLWEEPLPLHGCSVRRRDSEAIAELRTLMALDPTFQASDTAFQLGVLLTRSHDFERAAQAYARAAELSLDEREVSVTYANLAEVTMLGGDAASALAVYQHALELSHAGREYTLALYGMAVALDRLGEHESALKVCEKAAQADRQTLDTLHSEGVFFEPSYERHYYEALGNEALSHLTTAPELRLDALQAAAANYRAFAAAAPEGDPYRAAAQADLAAALRELQTLQAEESAEAARPLKRRRAAK